VSGRPFNTLRPRVRRAFRLALRRPAWTEADVDAELRLHVELRAEQLVARGWPAADAEAEARRRFGPSWDEAVHTLHRSGHAREERLAVREHLDAFWHDLRYAVRGLRRAPRFALAAVLTLALGLGATTVVFSLVDHVVLRPLAYRDPGRLVVVREVVGHLRKVYPTMPANASHFLEWRRACAACEGLAAVKRASPTLGAPGRDPERLGAARVSATLFPLLGVSPALGRGFREDEDAEGGGHVVVLSDGFWRREFGADPSVVGRAITLNDAPYTVIGVLPAGFSLPTGDALGAGAGLPHELDVYTPLALDPHERTAQGEFDYVVLARLRPGATVEQARAQLDAVEARFAERMGTTFQAAVVPLHAQVVGGAGRPLLLLLAAVGAVLLIVCVNLANLLLARHAARRREAAVRVALGAGAARLARLALVESAAVAVAGGLLGVLLARWGLGALVALAPATLPRVGEVTLDGRVFGAATLVTALVGLLVGVVPAVRAGRADPGEALKAGGRTATAGPDARRRRALFVGAQVAFSTVLLMAAGLFLRSFVRVLHVDRGFATEHVLALDVALPRGAYGSDAQRGQFYDRALAEVAAVPGVTAVAAASALPLEGEVFINAVQRAEDGGAGGEPPQANFRFVSPGYFAAVGTPLRRGRAFADGDRTRWVVVVSERVARALWPGQDPLGRRVLAGDNNPPAEVVGVAADVHTSTLESDGSLVIYLPLWEYPPRQGTVVARTGADPGAATAAARAALRRADPLVAVPRVRTMAEVVSAATAARRFQLGLLAIFAAMALLTAGVGIYGVIAQSLAARAGEIGTRLALGARPADVLRLGLGEGLAPVGIGLAAGVAGALAAGRGLQSLLFEVRPADPLTVAGVGAVLGLVAAAAYAIPARRAAAGDPARVLRLE